MVAEPAAHRNDAQICLTARLHCHTVGAAGCQPQRAASRRLRRVIVPSALAPAVVPLAALVPLAAALVPLANQINAAAAAAAAPPPPPSHPLHMMFCFRNVGRVCLAARVCMLTGRRESLLSRASSQACNARRWRVSGDRMPAAGWAVVVPAAGWRCIKAQFA